MGFTREQIAELPQLNGQRAGAQTRRLIEHKLLDVLGGLQRLEAELVQLANDGVPAPC